MNHTQRIEDVRTLANQTATFSIWIKADAAVSMTLVLAQVFGSGGSGTVNTTLGTASVTTSWQRFTFTVTVPSISGKTIGTGSYLQVGADLPTSSGTLRVGSYDFWGAQLEAGTFPTSYIPTTSAQVTRAADNASMVGTNFSSWYNQSEGTFIANANLNLIVPSGAYGILGASDGTFSNHLAIRFDNSGSGCTGSAWTNGVNQTSIGMQLVAVPEFVTSGYSFDSGSRTFTVKGRTPAIQNGYTLANFNRLDIGVYPSANYLNGHLKSFKFFSKRFLNTYLQSLTQ